MDIIAVPEIRWTETASQKVSKSVVFCSENSDNKHEFGTGFVSQQNLVNTVIIRLKEKCYDSIRKT